MQTYSFHGFIGREATLRAATKSIPAAHFEKLRFGLCFVPLTDELSAALAGGKPLRQISNEIDRLHADAAELGRAASMRGPVIYVEGEVEGGSGFHAAVVWNGGGIAYGPIRLEEREPVNKALEHLGIARDEGADAMTTLKLDERVPG